LGGVEHLPVAGKQDPTTMTKVMVIIINELMIWTKGPRQGLTDSNTPVTVGPSDSSKEFGQRRIEVFIVQNMIER
jgi:hypothetical protein